MRETDQKIIDAVIRKAKQQCPESLALIGIYGSVCTGDEHEKSDLDLLILINDEKGRQLADGFILDDEQIGYDLYCTSWEMLESEAECRHAHISKLMDSKIVYAADEMVMDRLSQLREGAAKILNSEMRYEKVSEIQEQIRKVYADAMIVKSIGELRAYAAYMISLSLDATMLWNGRYFKKGIKRTFEELEGICLPDDFKENIEKIVFAQDMSELSQVLTDLFRSIINDTLSDEVLPSRRDMYDVMPFGYTKQDREKAQPSKEALSGTYEEMFSNWKNKMWEAARRGDAFSSFMNLASFHFMLMEIAGEVEISEIKVMDDFRADQLEHNAKIFDSALQKYQKEYERIGLKIRCFPNVDSFVRDYSTELT